MRVSSRFSSLTAGLLVAAGCTFADPIGPVSEIIAFGDSLSDSGNASIATFGVEPGTRGPGYYYRSVSSLPYQIGEFTNAPTTGGPTGIWLDQLAPKLGVSAPQPFLPPVGGTNYAVASAVTGSSGSVNIDLQLAAFNLGNGGKAPSNALYTIWGGANDIANITNPLTAPAVGATAADNLFKNVLTLSSEGARYFLWPNLPDLGKTPVAIAGGPGVEAVASAASLAFDTEWATDLMKLQSDGISVVGLDVATLFAPLKRIPPSTASTTSPDPPSCLPVRIRILICSGTTSTPRQPQMLCLPTPRSTRLLLLLSRPLSPSQDSDSAGFCSSRKK